MLDWLFKWFSRLFGYSSKWKKEVIESLKTLVDSSEKVQLAVHESTLKSAEVIRDWSNFQTVLPQLSEAQKETRHIVKGLALRKLQFEVAFSQSYFERWINKDDFSSAFSVTGPGFKVVAKSPVKVLFEMSQSLPCDRFGTDQFGCFIDAEVQAGAEAYPITIHFSVGSRFLDGNGQFFMARAAKITSSSGVLTKLEIASFEKLLGKKIDEQLAKTALPKFSLQNSDNSTFKFKQMSMHITKHSSIYCSVKYEGKIVYPTKFLCFNPKSRLPYSPCAPLYNP